MTIEGVLDGKTDFDQMFAVPFADPSVQSAVTHADAALVSAGASSFTTPLLDLNTIAQTNSQTAYTQTGSSSSSSTSTDDLFGTAVLYNIAPNGAFFEPVYDLPSGQEDINLNTDTQLTIDRNAVTTDTDLTTQTYIINGTASAVGQTVALPPAAWQALAVLSMFGLVGLKRKCFPAPAFSPKSRRRL